MGDRLATIDMGRQLGGGLCPFLGGAELGPHVTQCGQGRGLPLYQVASWSIQPFGHNKHGQKLGAVPPFLGRVSWVPTCMPSFTLIHPTVWPQYTNVTDRTTVRWHKKITLQELWHFCSGLADLNRADFNHWFKSWLKSNDFLSIKSSAVAEMGDRGHNRHGSKRGPFAERWEPV